VLTSQAKATYGESLFMTLSRVGLNMTITTGSTETPDTQLTKRQMTDAANANNAANTKSASYLPFTLERSKQIYEHQKSSIIRKR